MFLSKNNFATKFEAIYTYTHKTLLESNFRFPQGVAGGRKSFDKAVDRLWSLYGESAGEGWIVDYCLAQLYYYKDSLGGKKKFSLNWSFGAKAVERYVNEKTGTKYYQNKWLKAKGIQRREIAERFIPKTQVHPLKKFIYPEYEEGTKIKKINTEDGYVKCGILTTLHAPKSSACQRCVYAERCKERLRKTNYELFRLRGIDG